jgi:hypothetical protein
MEPACQIQKLAANAFQVTSLRQVDKIFSVAAITNLPLIAGLNTETGVLFLYGEIIDRVEEMNSYLTDNIIIIDDRMKNEAGSIPFESLEEGPSVRYHKTFVTNGALEFFLFQNQRRLLSLPWTTSCAWP